MQLSHFSIRPIIPCLTLLLLLLRWHLVVSVAATCTLQPDSLG